MGRSSVSIVLLVALVLIMQGPPPSDALLSDISGFLDTSINTVNNVLRVAINFPFTPQNLRDRLQTLSTALETRDFATAITGIRDLISSKLSFLRGLINTDDLQQLQKEMQKMDGQVKNMTSMIADSMDKEMKSMAPMPFSGLSENLSNKLRPIISKIRNITQKVEGLSFTPDIIKESLRRIRTVLEEDNVIDVISGIRNVVKSGIRGILSASSNSQPLPQSHEMSQLENEFEIIRAETMALQLRAEEVQEEINVNLTRNTATSLLMSVITVLGSGALSHMIRNF